MTGLWLVSYLILWALVAIMGFLLFGVLQQLGLLQRQMAPSTPDATPNAPTQADDTPELEHDGPEVGSLLPNLVFESVNGYGTIDLTDTSLREGTLLICMSPLCEGCQHAVDPLNVCAASGERSERMIVLLRADEEATHAFLTVFPLNMPVVCDANRSITMHLGVHRNPFGLLYDSAGVLVRKGMIMDADHLRALWGDESASASARMDVFPAVGQRDEATEAASVRVS